MQTKSLKTLLTVLLAQNKSTRAAIVKALLPTIQNATQASRKGRPRSYAALQLSWHANGTSQRYESMHSAAQALGIGAQSLRNALACKNHAAFKRPCPITGEPDICTVTRIEYETGTKAA